MTALVLLLVAVLLPRDGRSDPLQVAVGVWPGVETLIVARERGLLPRDRVQLIDMTWPSAAMRAFENDVVDAAVLSLDEVLRLQESGRDLRVLMVLDSSEGADVLLGRGSTSSLSALRSKRIGVDIRSAGMLLLESALSTVGMGSNDVELVPLSLSEAQAAMDEQQVDAVVVPEPWATKIQRKPATVLFDSRQLKLPLYRVLVVSPQATRERSAELKLLMRAHFQMKHELDSPLAEDAWQVVFRREGLSAEEFRRCLQRVCLVDREASLKMMSAGGELQTLAKATERFMLETKLLDASPQSSEWLDWSLLEAVP